MKVRSGITLVEVLVAIFIMGVGLLAILVLFPVGALNMARAIRDDRAQQCGQQAEAIANLWDLRHNANVTAQLDAGPAPAATSYMTPRPDTPSYPVIIDPFGAGVGLAPLGNSGTSPGLRRVNPAVGTAAGQIPTPANNASIGERWFTLLDDLAFNADGTPAGNAGTSVQRYGSFTWTYIARRPQHGNRGVVDLCALVYRNRPVLAPSPEPTFACNGTTGDSFLTVTVGGDPELRAQGYILDVSVLSRTGAQGPSQTVAALPYQVMEIQKNGTTWTMRVEPPLRNPVNTVSFLEGVIAVFEKGTGWQP